MILYGNVCQVAMEWVWVYDILRCDVSRLYLVTFNHTVSFIRHSFDQIRSLVEESGDGSYHFETLRSLFLVLLLLDFVDL